MIRVFSILEVVSVQLDRENAFGDADLTNNRFPQAIKDGRFKLKSRKTSANPMREILFPKGDKKERENGG